MLSGSLFSLISWSMKMQEVENLVSGTLQLSVKEEQERRQQRKRRGILYLGCVAIVFLECVLLYAMGYSFDQLVDNILTVEVLSLLFGGWLCLFVKETLPAYYDENNVHTYSDGIFRMNLAGVNFNNSNWPHILHAGRLWLMSAWPPKKSSTFLSEQQKMHKRMVPLCFSPQQIP